MMKKHLSLQSGGKKMEKIKNNFTLKVLSLFIAIIMWSYVMGRENPVIDRNYTNIKVEFNNIESLERDNLIVMDPMEATVKVRVKGKKSDLDSNRFSSNNIEATVDLSGYQEGNVKIPVKVELFDQLSSIELVSFEPKNILFNIDKYITKEKNVTIKTVGNTSEDFIVDDITSKPSTILLKGPRTWVNQVSEVVGIVDITNRTETSNISVPLKLLDDTGNDIRGVDKEPAVVEVSIPIMRSLSLPIEIQTENELPEDYIITDMKVFPNTVAIKGNKEILNLNSIKTKPIDINTLLDKESMEVELSLPQGVELVDANQKVRISYKVEELIMREYTIISRDIDMRNIDTNLTVASVEEVQDIKINLKGTRAMLDSITEEDIVKFIDLNNLEEGTHRAEIKIDEIEGVTLDSIEPKFITIELETK